MTPNNDAARALEDFNNHINCGMGDKAVYELSDTTIKTIRTALKQDERVEGLVEALEFYAEPQNQAKEYRRSGCGIIWSHSSAYSNDKGERASEALQKFNEKE